VLTLVGLSDCDFTAPNVMSLLAGLDERVAALEASIADTGNNSAGSANAAGSANSVESVDSAESTNAADSANSVDSANSADSVDSVDSATDGTAAPTASPTPKMCDKTVVQAATCWSINSQFPGSWCKSNCMRIPRNCPQSICRCSAAQTNVVQVECADSQL
jgi:hypothetical protein